MGIDEPTLNQFGRTRGTFNRLITKDDVPILGSVERSH